MKKFILIFILIFCMGNISYAKDKFTEGIVIGSFLGYVIGHNVNQDFKNYEKRNYHKRYYHKRYYHKRYYHDDFVINKCKDVIVLKRINGRLYRIIEKRCKYEIYE